MKIYLFNLLIFFVLWGESIYSQDTPDKIVEVKLSSVTKTIKKDSVVNLELLLNIKDSWHINSKKPLDPNLVPTIISLKDTSAFKVIKIKYPEPLLKKLSFSENELSLYEYETMIKIMIIIDKNYHKKRLTISGKIQYQPCNNQSCLFPYTKSFSADLVIDDK